MQLFIWAFVAFSMPGIARAAKLATTGAKRFKLFYIATRDGYMFSTCPPDYRYNASTSRMSTETPHSISSVAENTFGYGVTHGILGLLKVRNRPVLVSVSKRTLIGRIRGLKVWRVDDVTLLPPTTGLSFVQREFAETARWVFQKKWYYAEPGDADVLVGGEDEFLANKHMLQNLQGAQDDGSVSIKGFESIMVRAIYGYVGIKPGANGTPQVAIIHRTSTRRPGLATFVRCMNAKGDTANTIQSVMSVQAADGRDVQYKVLRGSPPVVLDDAAGNLSVLNNPEVQRTAFKNHMEQYKPSVVIDLLNGAIPAEKHLYEALKQSLAHCKPGSLKAYHLSEFSAAEYEKKKKEKSVQEHETKKKEGSKRERLKLLFKKAYELIQKFIDVKGEVQSFIESLVLPNDISTLIRVDCIDSVGDTDVVVAHLFVHYLPQLLSKIGVAASDDMLAVITNDIMEMSRDARAQLTKQYFDIDAGKHSGILERILAVASQPWVEHQQLMLDWIFDTLLSPYSKPTEPEETRELSDGENVNELKEKTPAQTDV